MKKTEVKFIIKPGGEMKMEVLNGEGESCLVATKDIQESIVRLGSNQIDEGKKPEFYDGGGVSVFNDLGI